MPILPVGPWPEGQDTKHDPYNKTFDRTEDRRARAARVYNCDLKDDGWPKSRGVGVERVAGTRLFGGRPWGDYLLLQDQGTVTAYDSSFTSTPVLTGLDASVEVQFEEFGGELFWTNGIASGRILSDLSATYWGLAAPSSATLTTTAGSLTAGDYRVAVTAYDSSSGIESPAGVGTTITLDGTQAIRVSAAGGVDANASHLNFYVSRLGEKRLLFAGSVAKAALPYDITSLGASRRPLRGQFLSGPPAGTFLFKYLGYLFVGTAEGVYFSLGMKPHLFDFRKNVLMFPGTPRAGAGLQSGFYVATSSGLFWFSGESPSGWRQQKVDDGVYAKGALVLSGARLPRLQLSALVALFVSESGLVAGLPGGQVVRLTDDQLNVTLTEAKARIVYHEADELRRVLFSVR